MPAAAQGDGRGQRHRNGGILSVASAVYGYGDALDFDLFDRWRVRLRDVPSTIGWGAVALFLRHLPYDSETMREAHPETRWTVAEHRLADIVDLLGSFLLGDAWEGVQRPGGTARKRFEDAQPVSAGDMDAEIADFIQGKRK